MIAHPDEWLSAYLDNELSAEDQQRIKAHLADCEQCRLLLEDLREMQLQVADAYRSVEAPQEMEQQIMQAIEAKTAAQAGDKAWFVVPLSGILSLTAVWLLFGTVLFRLLSVLFKFFVAAIYSFSHIAAAIPSIWGAILLLAISIGLISSFSLRRLLGNTTS